jgi:hypothetical protein
MTTFKRAAIDVECACTRVARRDHVTHVAMLRRCDAGGAYARRVMRAVAPAGLPGESDARSCEDGRSTVPAARP